MRRKRARDFKRNGNNLLPAKKTSVSGKSAGTPDTALPVIANCRPASATPLPTWLVRLLPAGAVAGWGLHPLESAAFARRTPIPDRQSSAFSIANKAKGDLKAARAVTLSIQPATFFQPCKSKEQSSANAT